MYQGDERRRAKNRHPAPSVGTTTYAVEGFGEAAPPQDLLLLVVCAGFAGTYHQNDLILGGLAALQTARWRKP